MEPLASQLPIYTSTARAIAPQNRLIDSENSQFTPDSQSINRNADTLRSASDTRTQLNGSLDNAGALLSQASIGLSRIGDALDEIDVIVTTVEENSDLSRQQRAQLNAQIEDYLAEIDDIAANSTYNDIDLLSSDQTITLQVGPGASAGNRLDVELSASGAENLAAGLSGVEVSDDAGVANARTLVDAAQEALRGREIALAADQGSLTTARDQNRVSQVAGENILQAQLAASENNGGDDVQGRILKNLQAYLGNISSQLASQTVTVGGFSLPEPQADPFLEPQETPIFDPTVKENDISDQDFFGQTVKGTGRGQSLNIPAFSGYDDAGSNTSGGGNRAERQSSRVSVDA